MPKTKNCRPWIFISIINLLSFFDILQYCGQLYNSEIYNALKIVVYIYLTLNFYFLQFYFITDNH